MGIRSRGHIRTPPYVTRRGANVKIPVQDRMTETTEIIDLE